MDKYLEGLEMIEASCGNGKDNIIALATIAIEDSSNGNPRPFVREVDAYYEDGVFYVTTWGKSNKIMQVEHNEEVAFVVCQEGISGSGIGKNLGWVMDPKNAELRLKLRKAFANWYDHANNEEDENCVIMAIEMTRGAIFRDEGKIVYNLDFINKRAL
ncbi:pyridoxamine 5'-phosphate oxidase family protein [Acidaminobacter sp. JC074]|uniref:pyridoxamine 5'-phosphate oxidase family protein n=1 Tax=Acidaminobacter sp. JC074 TaxID=2530199 RepID=UPI001F0EA1AB|nr:pyridoxamine 5'-phosphate oxidase family protein [Acidaminobacter sp. JC074]MCH4886610.1 pyridoxamine 5'-phosphate oxidase family protein [Acidaminobacter sp. JC074]